MLFPKKALDTKKTFNPNILLFGQGSPIRRAFTVKYLEEYRCYICEITKKKTN